MFGTILLVPDVVGMPMTEPSEILREEHEVIEHLLHVLGGMAKRVDYGERIPKEDIDDALEVVVNFADKCHHAKEEKVLFPALVEASPKEGGALVRRLEGDHAAGRHLVAAMRSEAPAVESGDRTTRAQFAKDARSYVALLDKHIDEETKQLLPMVDRVLPETTRAKVSEEFDRIEREETGAGLHEKYEGTIHRLAGTYVHAEVRVQ